MFSFTPQSLVHVGESRRYPLKRNLDGTLCRIVRYENINLLLFFGDRATIPRSSASMAVTILTSCPGCQQNEKKITYAVEFWIVIFTCYYSCVSYWIYTKHKTSEKCMMNFKREAWGDLIGRFWRIYEFNIRSRSKITCKCTWDLRTPNEVYGFLNGEFRK